MLKKKTTHNPLSGLFFHQDGAVHGGVQAKNCGWKDLIFCLSPISCSAFTKGQGRSKFGAGKDGGRFQEPCSGQITLAFSLTMKEGEGGGLLGTTKHHHPTLHHISAATSLD